MAEGSRKNPRKSKIVLRECVNLEDDMNVSSEMQIQSPSAEEAAKSLLPKLKTSMTSECYLEKPPSPVYFNIEVDVESCKDEDDQNQDVEEINDNFENYLMAREIIISNDAINIEIAKLASCESYTNRILTAEFFNMLGKYRFELHQPDHYEKLIQNIMHQWKLWYTNSKVRTTIFAYKCNICCVGWWHLQPFWDHIKIHKHVSLSLASYNHECCVVASQGEWYENVCMCKIEGHCPKCLRTYEEHQEAKNGTQTYICQGCQDRFVTCRGLFVHEGHCIRCQKIICKNTILTESMWTCQICEVPCLTEKRYNMHFELYHTVRSDLPIENPNRKECPYCKMRYHNYNLHACPTRSFTSSCSFCCRKFRKKELAMIHMENSKKGITCKICKRHLKSQCMEMEHLLKHNRNFLLVYKCGHCLDNVLLSEEWVVTRHVNEYHRRKANKKHDKRLWIYDLMLVPRSCMSSVWADGVSVADMVIEPPETRPKTKSPAPAVDTPQDEAPPPTVAEDMDDSDKAIIEENRAMNKMCFNLKTKLLGRYAKIKPDPNEVEPMDELLSTAGSNHDAGAEWGTEDVYDDDDDIMETQNSVDALLSNIIIKKDAIIKDDVIIQEPKWDCIEIEDSDEDDDMKTANKDVKSHVVVKQEAVEEKHTGNLDHEDVKENTADEKKKYVEKKKDERMDVELAIVKQEPVSTDIECNDKNSALKTNLNNIQTEVVIKQESEESDECGDDAIDIEQKACLEELSKVFKATKDCGTIQLSGISLSEEIIIKEEMMDHEDYKEDIIMLNNDKGFDFEDKERSDKTSTEKSTTDVSKDISDSDLSRLEPDVQITPGLFHKFLTDSGEVMVDNRQRKAYRCKCGFEGRHKEFRHHVQTVCLRKKHKNPKTKKSGAEYGKDHRKWLMMECSKCNVTFNSLRCYYNHFTEHGLKRGECPQCGELVRPGCSAADHLAAHVKSTFLKVHVLRETVCDTWRHNGIHECKICQEKVVVGSFFVHWERHLQSGAVGPAAAAAAPPRPAPAPAPAPAETNQYMYTPEQLQKLTEQLVEPAERSSTRACVHCARSFDRRNDVKRHVVEHLLRHARAQGGFRLACPLCPYSTEKLSLYKVHLRNHASLPVFRCEMCNKCFSDSSNFAKHKKVHNFAVLSICDLCQKKFNSKLQLEKHMEMHRSTQPTECGECARVFYTPTAFRRHHRAKHQQRTSVGRLCTICIPPVRFTALRALWTHMWEAHNQRSVQADCPICKRSFRKIQEVSAHLRTMHKGSGVRVYSGRAALKRRAGGDGKGANGDARSALKNATVLNAANGPKKGADAATIGGPNAKRAGDATRDVKHIALLRRPVNNVNGLTGRAKTSELNAKETISNLGVRSKGSSPGSGGARGAGGAGSARGAKGEKLGCDVETFLSNTTEVTLADVIVGPYRSDDRK